MSKTTGEFAPEVRARAVRMVPDHERYHPSRQAAMASVAEEIGCVPQALHERPKKAEADSRKRAGVPTEVAERAKAPEREVRELRRADDILRKPALSLPKGHPRAPLRRRSAVLSGDDRLYRRASRDLRD